MTTSDAQIRAMAGYIRRLEKRLDGLVQANQLRSSSIENGAIEEYDGEGTLTAIIGRQYDSTHGAVVVNGPLPPQPAAPSIISTPGGVIVRYDGTWAELGAVAPMDFSHFEVHVGTEATLAADTFDTLRGTINTARGGDVVVPWASPVPLYARVVARSLSGRVSTPSDVAGPVTSGSMPTIISQAEEPEPLRGDASGVWYDTDNDNKPYIWNGVAWAPAPFGTGAIGPNSLVASQVLATESITAPLFAAVIILASTIIGGNPAGYHATLSEEGIVLYAVDPNGAVVRVGGLGTGDDALSFIDPSTGDTTFSIDRLGHQVTRSLSVEGEDTNGDGVINGGLDIFGRPFLAYIDDLARGGNASGLLVDAANGVLASGITTPFGLGEISFDYEPGRHYLTVFDGLHYSSASAGRGLLTMRYTNNGDTPRINNGTIVASKIVDLPNGGQAFSAAPIMRLGTFGTIPTVVRVLVHLERILGSDPITVHTYGPGQHTRAPFRFFNLDMGRDLADTYIANDGGGTRSGYTTNPTPPPAKKTYTSTWGANFEASFLGDGSRAWLNGPLYQGRTPYYTAGGQQKALAGFTGNAKLGETTKTITEALAGATVHSVEIYLHCNHSHYNSGGVARIGYHGNTTAPTTAPSSQYAAFGSASFNKGQARWITLPTSTHASWANGTYRGITVGPGASTDPIYYMRFTGGLTSGHRPHIRIRYTR